MNRFVSLTNETIVDLISKANSQVIYTAPAMDTNIANEIVQFVQRTCVNQVTVVLDLSSDVYKEGYGDAVALDILEKGSISVKHVPGIRVGVLIVDDKSWIYSPVSKVSPTNINSQRKNAVFEELQNSILEGYVIMPLEPRQISIFGIEKEDDVLEVAATEEKTLSKQRMAQLKKEFKERPMPDFDLQRLLSEYRSVIQFIEVTFKGERIEQTTVKIPSELLNVTRNKEFEEKMKASYKLFNEDFSKYTKPLKEQVDEFRARYTRALSKKYGRVMLVKDKVAFEKEFQAITNKIEQYKKDLSKQINSEIQKTKQELIDYFTPVIMENPPEQLLHGDSKPIEEQDVKVYIEWLLGREFPTSEQVLKRVEFYHIYKDITEQILQDEQFYRQLERAFKDEYVNWPHQKQQQGEFSF